ncbi:MAG: winged helix-turn-helix domain-containing protein [Bryobacteraceae bacterium]|jgi:DNA-binding winged helix-turn-helix (wHTH) protein/Tol biopolymer transport system component
MHEAMRLYRFDDVIVQPDAFRVEKSGRVLALEPKAIRLLLYLIEHHSRAVSKEELLREIWEDVAVTDNALTRVVAQLRKALGDDAKVARYIETLPTLGYRFVAEVTVVAKGPENGGLEPKVATVAGPPPGLPARVMAPASLPVWQRTWAKIAAATVLALASLIAGVEWGRWRSPEPPVWSASLLGGSIIASHPRISPDGQMLAFRAIVDGESQVAIMKPDAASWTVLTHDRNHGSVGSVAWARDGSKIYFERKWGSGTVYTVGPLGGEPRLLLENAIAPEPLLDGSLIVLRPSSEGRQQLLRFWPDSGRLEPLPAAVLWSDTRTVCAFPDGKEIAVLGFYGSHAGARRLFALDLASRQARDLSAEDFAGASDVEGPQETLAVSADGRTVFTLLKRDDSMLLVALPRDGSKRDRALLPFPLGATPLACDAAPDGSIYMDQSAFESSVLSIGAAGNIISETPVPKDAHGVLPLPGGGFVFTLTRGGRSQLLAVTAGTEPRPLLNTMETARLPGAWLGSGKLAFVIGEGDKARLAIGSVEGGRVLQRFQSDAQHVTAIAASPDGHTVYYASDGALWAQPVSGGDPRKIGAGYDVAADPSGKSLYLMRAGVNGYELLRMPASGGEAEKIDLPAGYSLTPFLLSPAAVNRDGRILVSIKTLGVYFFQTAIFDPARHTMAVVPVPFQTVVNNAGWAVDGSIDVQITHWSSTLWRYRMLLKRQASR